MSLPVLEAAMPYIEAELSRSKDRVTAQAMQSSNSGTLTQEMALQLWAEYLAIERLARSLRARKKIAIADAHKFPG